MGAQFRRAHERHRGRLGPHLAIDECSVRTNFVYATVLSDPAGGVAIDMAPGRDGSAVLFFVAVVRAEELPGEPVEVDARAVREILSNLLDNARRHAVESIRLLIAVQHLSLEIRVVDDGPGIPAHLSDRAFGRFVSLDGKGGSGLGVPIARELARAHGGDLSYAGREEGFLLRLPL